MVPAAAFFGVMASLRWTGTPRSKTRIKLLLLGLVALGLVVPSVALAEQQLTLPPAGKDFGFNGNFQLPDIDSATYASLIKTSGGTVARLPFDWWHLEPQQDTWNEPFWAQYRKTYDDMLADGITPILAISSSPPWSRDPGLPQLCTTFSSGCWYPPARSMLDQWRQFVVETTERFPQATIEVWNEENLTSAWKGGIDPARYAELLATAYDAVKQVNPSAKVIMGGLALAPSGSMDAGDFLNQAYAANPSLKGHTDAVNLHLYSIADLGSGTADGQFLADARQIRAHYSDDSTPLFISEMGATTTGPHPASEDQQAEWILRAASQLLAMPDVQGVIVHTLVEPPQYSPSSDQYGFGLMHYSTSTPLEPKRAYCQLVYAAANDYPTCPPVVSIDAGPVGPTNDVSPSFSFSSPRTGASFECSLDGSPFLSCTSPLSYPALTPGPHSFQVRALGSSGIPSYQPAQRDFTIDLTPPETSLSGPSGPVAAGPSYGLQSSEPSSGFECSLDTGAYHSCQSPYSPQVADGHHALAVRAVDQAGNRDPTPAQADFTLDTQAPTASIDSGPSGPTNDPRPSFAFSANEPGVSFECRFDSADFAPCSGGDRPDTALAEGDHSFSVRATDQVGNTGPVAQRAFSVDTTAPETSVQGPTSITTDPNPSFTLQSSETGSSFRCSLDGSAYRSCPSPYLPGPLGDGVHQLSIKATDPAGNEDPTPASQTLTVDTQAPDALIDSGPQGPTNDPRPSFAFSADEPNTSFECRFDTAAFASCSDSARPGSPLPEGSHSFSVRASDQAGNTGPAASRSFRVDLTPPETSLLGPSGPVDASPTYQLQSSEAGSSFECSLDGGSYHSCQSPYSPQVADGHHTLAVSAIDQAGNRDPTPAQADFTLDTKAPTTSIDAGPSGLSNDPEPSFGFSANEPNVSFECRFDSADFSPCSGTEQPASALSEGEHKFSVRATDPAGNTGPITERAFSVDTTAPETSIQGPSGTVSDSNPSFTLQSSEAGSTFRCSLDGSAYRSCPSRYEPGPLTDGPHTLSVKATDQAGNEDSTPASQTLIVDTRAPDALIDSGPQGSTNDARPAFGFSADEPNTRFECRFDSADFASCSSPDRPAWPLVEGSHSFSVRASDQAGNTGVVVSRSFRVDLTPPETSILGPSGPIKTSPTYQLQSSEASSGFECSLDGGVYRSCQSPYAPQVADGHHSLAIRAVDQATNRDPTPAQTTFELDTQAPTTSIDSGPAGPTNDPQPSFTFSANEHKVSFQCRFDSEGFSPCSGGDRPISTLTEGEHTFSVQAVDQAGNAGPPSERAFSVDTTGPETSIAGPRVKRPDLLVFKLAASDQGAGFECSLDRKRYRSCPPKTRLHNLRAGRHLLAARAMDTLGNRDPSPAKRRFRVGRTS
jgi:hypothetical protein